MVMGFGGRGAREDKNELLITGLKISAPISEKRLEDRGPVGEKN